MTKSEFNRKYPEAVSKCALGIAIISRTGPSLGLDAGTISQNREILISSLAKGVGVSRQAVALDVYNEEDRIPAWLWRNRDFSHQIRQMKNEFQGVGLLPAG
jgi:hypothetical protein